MTKITLSSQGMMPLIQNPVAPLYNVYDTSIIHNKHLQQWKRAFKNYPTT
jgi:hypothetical protein